MEGKILGGRYELLGIVGQGGMGTVYKARCRILDRIVAVKILKEEFSGNASFVEKFRTEAMAAARIAHPNIVNVYDVGQDNGVYYIVMEYVEGQTLKQYIASQGVVPLATAINIAVMICDGVQFAHENQVIHRDLKPQNILITNQGNVKVADFGIARANTTSTITFNREQVIGSVHYISPEQARGAGVSYATDIYSIGCILYEMCTGQMPFDAESPVTVALKHLHDEPFPPADLNPEISPELEDIILHAMMKLPDRRFASAEEMGKELLWVAANMKKQGGILSSRHDAVQNTEQEMAHEKLAAAQEVKQNLSVNGGNSEAGMPPQKRRVKPYVKLFFTVMIVAFLAGIGSSFASRFFGEEVTAPRLVGYSLEEAERTASAVGLKLNVISRQPDKEYDVDIVVHQDPEENTKVKKGREIKIIVSNGLENETGAVFLKDLVGMTLEEAQAYLEENELELGGIEEITNSTYQPGIVVSHSPEKEQNVAPGTKVFLQVSAGEEKPRVKMPNLVGLSQQEAENKLSAAGLKLGNVSYTERNDGNASGKILEQSIEAEAMVPQGTSVSIKVSKQTEETEKEPETEKESEPETTSEPTEPESAATGSAEESLQTKAVTIQLPSGKNDYDVSVEVNDAHGQRSVYHQTLNGGVNMTLNLSYYGSGTYQVYLDGTPDASGNL